MNEEQIKSRLISISKEEKRTFNDLLKQLAFERMLARVAFSAHKHQLIFKGGLCLKQFVNTERETKDIDFLLREINSGIENVQKIFEDVLIIDLSDSFHFLLGSVLALEAENKQYPGYRVIIQLNLGKTKDILQVDIGVGDVVDEFEMHLQLLKYKGNSLMGEKAVSILAYPPEYIFSEKLQAIIDLGSLNSRMKDYFDCHILITQNVLDAEKVKAAVTKTFKNRKTAITKIQDVDEGMVRLWSTFQKKVTASPKHMNEVIKEINSYLDGIKVF
jgi:predicted nucleotidyltransferase component of viral defense system